MVPPSDTTSVARQILLASIQNEEDPEFKHWGELFIVELARIESNIDTIQVALDELKKIVADLKDKVVDKDHAHDLSLKDLETRLSYITLGGSGASSLIVNAIIYLFQLKSGGGGS